MQGRGGIYSPITAAVQKENANNALWLRRIHLERESSVDRDTR